MKAFLQFLKSRSFFIQLALMGIFSAILLYLLTLWLANITNHNQKIEVPELSELLVDEATETLDLKSLRIEVIDTASFNPKYPPQSIVYQTPKGGSFVKENRKIYVRLNASSYPKISVPHLIGKSKRQVVSQLSSLGFLIDSDTLYVKDMAKDVVRGLYYKNQEIIPYEKLPKKSTLTLLVGDGLGEERNPIEMLDSIP